MKYQEGVYFWAVLRIGLGLIFLWAFFDKLIGLGFATCRGEGGAIQVMCESAWLSGGSPTTGFLSFATKGPLAGIFQSLAGSVFIDWIFMIGLLGMGLALVFGFLVNIASISGALMMVLMWLAVLLPEHHPFLDDHIIYAIILIAFIYVHAGKRLGIGTWWSNLRFVKKYPWLE